MAVDSGILDARPACLVIRLTYLPSLLMLLAVVSKFVVGSDTAGLNVEHWSYLYGDYLG